ncbi:Transposase DDE domain-containing protein [Fodinibius roseus]|uniref:Transposase DDE domain-containing protein n=1 Tax=Fodinibius roseus TaxID=1194090 RepID=A0A1M4Z0F6_9BACT|nr:transposase [Fodinibius roseus]SHF11470.1 Transposase DDE domain-containing protein [Fodinibius roseus]
MNNRHQLSILDQWASESGQVSRSRRRLAEAPSGQIDTDADATQKGGTHYFGYKGHIGVDVGSKLIRQVSFTGASPHDSTELEALLSGDERAVFGDKAYPSKDVKITCREQGVYYGISGQGLPQQSAQRGPKAAQQAQASGAALRRAPVCGDQRSLRNALGHRQKQAAQQSPVHRERNLLEHRALHQLGQKETKRAPGQSRLMGEVYPIAAKMATWPDFPGQKLRYYYG